MTARSTERVYWLDALKAIGLFFVILGHTDGIAEWLRTYIHSFHIPLFFFISGCLANRRDLAAPFSPVWRRHFRSLILPYFTFGFISYMVWLLAGRFYGRDVGLAVSPVRPLIGMLYGIGVNHWLRHNVSLWFLPALFSLRLIFYWLQRYCTGLGLAYGVIFLSLVGGTATTVLPFRLPWGIEPACIGLMFYWAGYAGREQFLLPEIITPQWSWLLMLVSLAIQFAGINANVRVDINSAQLGNQAAFFLAAFSGIVFWCLVAQALPRWKALSLMARESMVIFSLHTLCFSIFTFTVIQWLPLEFKQDSAFVAGCYTIGSITLLTSLAPKIRKWLPWLSR